ncbi:MAG: hypothetical protein AAFV25_27785 [Bacteroidota bacterium]
MKTITIHQLIGCLLLLGHSMTAWGQNSALKKYEQVIHSFYQTETMAFQSNMILYEGLHPEKKFDQMRLEYRKKGDRIYMRHEEFEILQDDQDYLYMDHEDRIVYQMPMSEELLVTSSLAIDQFKGIIQLMHLKGETFSVRDGVDGIRFSAPEFSQTKIEIHYKVENQQMVKAMMALDLSGIEDVSHELDGKRLEIYYQEYENEGVSFPFRKKQLLAADENGQLKSGPYKGYQFINTAAEK